MTSPISERGFHRRLENKTERRMYLRHGGREFCFKRRRDLGFSSGVELTQQKRNGNPPPQHQRLSHLHLLVGYLSTQQCITPPKIITKKPLYNFNPLIWFRFPPTLAQRTTETFAACETSSGTPESDSLTRWHLTLRDILQGKIMLIYASHWSKREILRENKKEGMKGWNG